MDERVKRIDTPEGCERFAKNAIARGRPDLALEAQRRAVELRANKHNAQTSAEKEALQAVYAYEEVLAKKNGKKTRATRTWQMIKHRGILGAVENEVNRDTDAMGYTLLVEMGMQDLAFEATVLRHPDQFSTEAVERARERIESWKSA